MAGQTDTPTQLTQKVFNWVVSKFGWAAVIGGIALVVMKSIQVYDRQQEIIESIEDLKADRKALYGTTKEHDIKIEVYRAKLEMIERFVIIPARKIGLVSEEDHARMNRPMPTRVKESEIGRFMLEQRVEYGTPSPK